VATVDAPVSAMDSFPMFNRIADFQIFNR